MDLDAAMATVRDLFSAAVARVDVAAAVRRSLRLAGDALYGGRTRDLPLDRQFLHARRLRFALPGGEPIDAEAPLPDDLTAVLRQLEARA